jgi:hypothetical protein
MSSIRTLFSEEKKMKTNGFFIGIISFCALFAWTDGKSILIAQPKSANEIPVFPGAVRNADRESELRGQMGWEDAPSLRNAALYVYNTGASSEEVFGFYLQKTGGREGVMDLDPSQMKPGAISPVLYEIEYYRDEDFEDYPIEQGVTHRGVLMKQKLIQNRKPHQPGKWIIEARFNWYHMKGNGDLADFYVIVHDESFDIAPPEQYKTRTEVQIQATTTQSGQAMRGEDEESMDDRTAGLAGSLKKKPPTEKELGVPVYPGATFDAENSAGMSAGNDYAMYIYLSADPALKVASFYEQQLKKKANEAAKGHYLIPLKGDPLLPEEGISIEPNTMFGGAAKTVITIQKKTVD